MREGRYILSEKNLDNLLINCPSNEVIANSFIKTWRTINSSKYEKIVCSISGGSDSDIMLDLCWRCDKDNKIDYVWFDTGLEYQATKSHLKYLEEKYKIEIKPYKAIKSIAFSCRKYGQPFISKNVSNMLNRLQNHGFQWEDESLEVLLEKYCQWDEEKQDWFGCKSALRWWCNAHKSRQYCIDNNKCLKEFIMNNPVEFKVSSACCDHAKKDVAHKLISEYKYDLNIHGVRKAEGGIRAGAYKSCFSERKSGCSSCGDYRPIFWYTNFDKVTYEKYFNIIHSKCYTEYGLKRTGCAGCPYGREFEYELSVIKKYEPKLYKAVNNIFKDSYEYTRRYNELR